MHQRPDSAAIRPNNVEHPVLDVIEQSSRKLVRQYAFQPNDAKTWAAIRAALSNYLTGMWRDGKLSGAKSSDAFAVACGLGSTMTQADVLNGQLIAVVQVAVVHPAEFVQITIQQSVQPAD